uniref:Uncharacterized protein n=1 Tax=Acrobeloides nanus TaxID=290746 RepID=A0A914CQ89_9BILA
MAILFLSNFVPKNVTIVETIRPHSVVYADARRNLRGQESLSDHTEVHRERQNVGQELQILYHSSSLYFTQDLQITIMSPTNPGRARSR